ncbi:MAG: hypothetical protein ABJO36_00735 [Litorimonas sp.]
MSELDPSEAQQPEQRRVRRASRYQRVQERKAQQRASDQRFYNAMFTLMGVLALFAVLLGAIMMNGVPQGVSGMQGWTTPWVFGFSKMEVAGFAFVGVIALAVGLRMRGRR